MGRDEASRQQRIGLVGCVKSKGTQPAPAQDLYTSPLFAGRRRWVERTCGRWFILSAKCGLLTPDRLVAPYDETLTKMPFKKRREWSNKVLSALQSDLGDLGVHTFELHAGRAYLAFGIEEGLRRAGAQLEVPCRHLSLGRQLALYHTGPPVPREGLT